MSEPVLECRHLARSYDDGARVVEVLVDVNLRLQAGEKVAVMGASGAGKSTLLNLLGGLDTPSAGEVTICGKNPVSLNEAERCALRNREMGFVYQFHHLLPEFDALENVAMPLLISGAPRRSALDQAEPLLQRVGLGQRLHHRPGQLSGGERQRVAIARALVAKPACVLMDEPTGNLDPGSAQQVLALIDELREHEAGFVVVTHDADVAAHMDCRYQLAGGTLEQI